MKDKTPKHLYWVAKNKVKSYLKKKGGDFFDENIYDNIVHDVGSEKEKYPDGNLDYIVKDVVGYYVEEMFPPTQEQHLPEGSESLEGTISDKDMKPGDVRQETDLEQSKRMEEEKVLCKLCGKEYKVLYPHLLAKHHVSPDEYRKMFPNAKLRAGVPEQEKKNKKKESSFNYKLRLLKTSIREVA